MSGKAGIIGLGLIGGSIGIALREAGWHVVGQDVDQAVSYTHLTLPTICSV